MNDAPWYLLTRLPRPDTTVMLILRCGASAFDLDALIFNNRCTALSKGRLSVFFTPNKKLRNYVSLSTIQNNRIRKLA